MCDRYDHWNTYTLSMKTYKLLINLLTKFTYLLLLIYKIYLFTYKLEVKKD